MIKFGKKINYRPLLISLGISLFVGLIFLMISKLVGLIAFLGVFAIIFGFYYLRSLPIIFNYWEASEDYIQYSDLKKISKRLKAMLVPFPTNLRRIGFTSISTVTIAGDLVAPKNIPTAIPYSGYLAVISPSLSMVNNPVDITFNLNDGTSVTLSVARDLIYQRKSTLKKLDQLFQQFEDNGIKINNQTNHELKLI
ncbi:hypothetical protein COSHB9_17740 [Companilactobacillus alimentarius]|uniref:Uncharacterized protein n=2 Tax=Companilactobacillus alimentarius TaxID=1602 RepID=A0A2K9HI74_9LACO|nr:hypothetical protein LA20249_08615 [Companilactobacillus alimentarius DSM 20249]GEO45462.1 hypothetical protein LAL01_16940 [Companilactobacillus alimentarius]